MRVLFVDDDSSVLKQAKIFLEEEEDRLNIETAGSAGGGLELLEEEDFDAIVSDYQMPQMDGLEFLNIIREEKNNDIPFIIFTGKGREEVAMDALNHGANRYLQKKGDPKSQYRVLAQAIVQEIKHHEAKKAFEKSEERYRNLFEKALDPIFLADAETGVIVDCNGAAADLIGRDKSDIIGQHQKVLHPSTDSEDEFTEGFVEHVQGNKREIIETRVVTESGELRDVAIKGNLIEADDKTLVQGIFRDITERKEMEEKLRKSERKSRRNFEASPDPVFLLDENGVFSDVNETALQILGFEKGEIVGSSLWDTPLFPDETMEKTTEMFERRKEGEEIPPYTVELETKDGERIITEVNVGKFEGDGFEGEIVIARDITERKKAEEKFRRYVENSPYGIFVVDREGNYQEVNEAACEITGYSEEELLDMNILDLHDSTVREKVWGAFERLKGEGEMRSELPFRRKNGTEGYMDVYAIRLSEDRNLAFVEDITKRKETEAELNQTKEYYRTIVETSPEAIAIVDLEGKIVDCNQKLVEMGGFDSEEEIIGKEAFEFIASEDRERTEEYLEKTLEKGEIKNIEYTFLDSDGNEYLGMLSASVIQDPEGNPVLLMAIVKDITDRKEVEEREEFLHSLLRHDLKNKANVVRGYLEKIKDFDFPEEAELYIEEALKTTVNERDLIEKVRNLRKLEDEDVQKIEISQILDQVFNNFKKQASEKDIELEFDKVECKVRGGPLLEELFSNLIENSFQHSGCDRIRIMGEDDGEWCVVSVIDDGEGIPDGEKEKIFNREFKDGEESGSGLGLYLVKRIVDDYGGEIEVKDSENGGARFDVRLRKSENWNE